MVSVSIFTAALSELLNLSLLPIMLATFGVGFVLVLSVIELWQLSLTRGEYD